MGVPSTKSNTLQAVVTPEVKESLVHVTKTTRQPLKHVVGMILAETLGHHEEIVRRMFPTYVAPDE